MAEYDYLPRYSWNDRDAYDLFRSGRLSKKQLRGFALRRGLVVPKGASLEEIADSIARVPLSWGEIELIQEILSNEEGASNQSISFISGLDEIPELEEVVEALQESRRNLEEVYQLSKVDESSFKIDLTHVDTDPTRSIGFQRERKHVSFELEYDEEGTLSIRHDATDRGAEVKDALADAIQASYQGEDDTTLSEITLSGITDPAKRIEFFRQLIHGVEGFEVDDIFDLKMERLIQASEEELLSTDDDEEEEEEAIPELRNAILKGTLLDASQWYLDLRKAGYFISRAKWRGREIHGEGRIVEFNASFKNAIQGEGFEFGTHRFYRLDDFGLAARQKRKKLSDKERGRLRNLLIESARNAISSIQSDED